MTIGYSLRDIWLLKKIHFYLNYIIKLRLASISQSKNINFHHPNSKKIIGKLVLTIKNLIENINLPTLKHNLKHYYSIIEKYFELFYNNYNYDNYEKLLNNYEELYDEIFNNENELDNVNKKHIKDKKKRHKEKRNIREEALPIFNEREDRIDYEHRLKVHELEDIIRDLEIEHNEVKKNLYELKELIKENESKFISTINIINKRIIVFLTNIGIRTLE